jgi:hypothetical protein
VDVGRVVTIGPEGRREAAAEDDLNHRGFCPFPDPDGNGWAVRQTTARP